MHRQSLGVEEMDSRWYEVMTGLLYPGVLGALIYTFAETVADHGTDTPLHTLFAALAFFVIFALDFVHSLAGSVRATYGATEFWVDLLLLAVVFIAGKFILKRPDVVAPMWLWLAAARLFASGWEFFREGKSKAPGASGRVTANFKIDLLFMFAYLAGGLLNHFEVVTWPWLLVAVMFLDAGFYLRYRAA